MLQSKYQSQRRKANKEQQIYKKLVVLKQIRHADTTGKLQVVDSGISA